MSFRHKTTTVDDHFTVEALQELAFYDSLFVSENPAILSQVEHLKTLVNMVDGEPETRQVGLVGEMIRTIVNQHNELQMLRAELHDLNEELRESSRVVSASAHDDNAFTLFDPDTGHSMRVKYDR